MEQLPTAILGGSARRFSDCTRALNVAGFEPVARKRKLDPKINDLDEREDELFVEVPIPADEGAFERIQEIAAGAEYRMRLYLSGPPPAPPEPSIEDRLAAIETHLAAIARMRR
jgi:hypothetical protein